MTESGETSEALVEELDEDPFGGLERRELCSLGREWLLHGHLQDRIGMPLVLENSDRETMEKAAIDQWMAASPVYSRRVQRALGFGAPTVESIFKNLQLDIGTPHQYLDVRYRLLGPDRGEFFLAHCGALLDVEPMGEEFVHGMCHTIEDPTFDATAGAGNPRARVRPLHRPPRTPAGREPHCHWTVHIDDGPPVAPHRNEALVAASLAATVTLPAPRDVPGAEPGGWADYSGPFAADFALEDLSRSALVIALREVALQSHLLFRSYQLAVEDHFGTERVAQVVPRVFAGLGGLTSERLRRSMRLPGGAESVARVLRLHPMLAPAGYVRTRIELVDATRVRFALRESPVTSEPDGRTWFARLGHDAGSLAQIAALVRGVDARARVGAARLRPDEVLAYEIEVDPAAPEAPEAPEVRLAKISNGAGFLFRQRRSPRGPEPVADVPAQTGGRP
ncbi:hypothetical protein Ga0074812_115150 [Parafrankia irregularis]|uniref:Uncharacterized protein n=1 Tax=Parafrankia irregularis TaxID=795642 RepID=A0A0S4QSZ1_9ACTN|nr:MULTISPECIES: hypothetical protein [Parafrankia]MBE3202759.1 hypothetical protein [Parafrankia sp. CH37]CUU57948.1 hypothetical protein Ga0074812_115150 [Parafrankia irregularis]